ncbi:hypothetical protein BF93_15265 [Brachybacterium phenoliresistens]|uniref:Glycosyltransferase 2-like domain-containing protein n=1 Tax=Brachybacterium phenoliresistens TaxID=396014 RepID=Z9JVD2_9MICO|nr:glycosyltransferase family A protein [Brachybacterium phenoliresistens]EWS81732.1 hypothetical protein BF93_15265 [Brachybacterium phenoliresistens]
MRRTDTGASPLISVIIPCHQAAQVLALQLEALSTQREAPSFEIVVVDNRSTDSLAAVVDAFRGTLLAAGAESVRLIAAPEEAGASYARNVGAAAARSSRLLFCDADDCVSAWWLSDASALFDQASVFSGSALPVLDDDFPSDVAAVRHRIEPRGRVTPELRPQARTAIPIIMGGNFGIERDLFYSLGGFDQSLPFAGEDNDLAARVREAGLPILDSPAMRIAYRTRTDTAAAGRIARRAASTHVLLCVRYDRIASSPFVGRGRLLSSTVRLGAAAVAMCLRPRRRDLSGLTIRAQGVLGFWLGTLRHRVLGRVPERRLGVGLHERPEPPLSPGPPA